MIDYPHTDSSIVNLADPLRMQDDVVARELSVACMARKVSFGALHSPVSMNQLGG